MFKGSLISKSHLRFKLESDRETELTAVLDPVSVKSAETDYDRATYQQAYEGFVTAISAGCLEDLYSGLTGEGTVNGQVYRIRLDEISRDSIAIASKIFGANIRISIIEKVTYGRSS
jgi:hypothetical protein